MPDLKLFHPCVQTWFRKTLGTPTPVQAQAWPQIQAGRNTLIAAPTGSGKTLAAFLAVIDNLLRRAWEQDLPDKTLVLYVSPLKALSNDIDKNLQRPLRGIEEEALSLGLHHIDIRTAVRTGDTPSSERQAMLKRPPHILISTPESLFVLLTSEGGRRMLRHVETVIVDEIHAMVGDKRGSHLALSLERLQTLTEKPLTRIGLSATQKPIETVAQFLIGSHIQATSIPCAIIDTGHRRQLDLGVEVPASPLSAVMAMEVWDEVYARMEQLIQEHRTTLLFVNTRRLAERVAHRLSQSLGEEFVAAHHGSLSKERRLDAEQRLKNGSLKVLVATASLELGIDIGEVDLVLQIGCPKSIAAFLQRVGRSGHTVTGTPKGRLFPLTRDELCEAATLLDAVRRGELDQLRMPEKPLDILAQQIAAEVACQEWGEEELFQLTRQAYPYRNLERKEFDEVVEMLAQGFTTRRGRRGALIHHDAINGRLRARPGARLTALTNGGAIPDAFDYEVRLDPENVLLGSINEDFAIESMPGDIFLLGNRSWLIQRVESSIVRVTDAHGQSPTIPFWLGEAPGRSTEFSFALARLREEIGNRLGPLLELKNILAENEANQEWKVPGLDWLQNTLGLNASAADQLLEYITSSALALGVMPTQKTLVLERFFDTAGDMHVVLHSPFGSRMNRAWGLSLRKRFCRKFNFELQAAATEDAIILSLGGTHSFALEEVFQYLRAQSVREILIQAMLVAPMFQVRWRWNASRSLALPRFRNGKKVPPQLQRMGAEDLIAWVFPDQIACPENLEGEREIPDHPLVRQTIHDCLTEAMDIEKLEAVLLSIEKQELNLVAVDLKEPSPLAQEIINARPYAFLDDAPLEERRTRAIQSRRYLDPKDASDLGKLDSEAIQGVQAEAWPQPRNAEELHDALLLMGFATEAEMNAGTWDAWIPELQIQNRLARGTFKVTGQIFYLAAERIPAFEAFVLNESLSVSLNWEWLLKPSLPERLAQEIWTSEKAVVEILRGRMETLGPVTLDQLAQAFPASHSLIQQTMLALENEGFVLRGYFAANAGEQWCERRLLARIHRYTLNRLRKEIEPVSIAQYMRFLIDWHHLGNAGKPAGPDALAAIIAQMEGYEAPATAWESHLFPARLLVYESLWLDIQCLGGETLWGRMRSAIERATETKKSGPIRTTPIAFFSRAHWPLWQNREKDNPIFVTGNSEIYLSTYAQQVFEHIQQRGASFLEDVVRQGAMLKTQVEDGLGELVSQGLVTADSFKGLRALLDKPRKIPQHRFSVFRGATLERAGRWSLLRESENATSDNSAAREMLAWVLLRRYGVVFRRLVDKESLMPSWRDLLRTFRQLEARGEIRGGRFVEGLYGEQFALPEAVTTLRRKNLMTLLPHRDHYVLLHSADPVNLQGILSSGRKIPVTLQNRILYCNGSPVAAWESGEIVYLESLSESEKEIATQYFRPSTQLFASLQNHSHPNSIST